MSEGLGIELLGSTAVRSCDVGRLIRCGMGRGPSATGHVALFGNLKQWVGTPMSLGGPIIPYLEGSGRDQVAQNGPVHPVRFFLGNGPSMS